MSSIHVCPSLTWVFLIGSIVPFSDLCSEESSVLFVKYYEFQGPLLGNCDFKFRVTLDSAFLLSNTGGWIIR